MPTLPSPFFVFTLLAVFLLTLLILAIFIHLIRRYKGRNSGTYWNPYYLKSGIVSIAEHKFLIVLQEAVNGFYIVNVKVRVADVIGLNTKGLNRRASFIALAKISQKHFDYVFLHPETYQIIAAVELDDSSHNTSKTMWRDSFINDLCRDVSLPLYRFKAKGSYHVNDIRSVIFAPQQLPENDTQNKPDMASPWNSPKRFY